MNTTTPNDDNIDQRLDDLFNSIQGMLGKHTEEETKKARMLRKAAVKQHWEKQRHEQAVEQVVANLEDLYE